jgi:hypothetical protein
MACIAAAERVAFRAFVTRIVRIQGEDFCPYYNAIFCFPGFSGLGEYKYGAVSSAEVVFQIKNIFQ